jgi:DNA-binding NarL/FixJ family response regulator
MNEDRIRLLLVDDHHVVRLGLAALFATVPHFEVVGQAGTIAEAVAGVRQCRPSVVIMDVRLPDGSGVEACREIRSELPDTRVVMLTSYADRDAVVASIMAGAAGYLLKQTEPERLIEAVNTVAQGGSLLDPTITESVLDWMRHLGPQGANDPLAGLSEQQRRILPLIAEGKTNREIAAELFLSEHTVKTYVSTILQKLQLTRRAEAAAYIAQRRPPSSPS